MALRMKDIADDLGVSLVTVSKVVNNYSDISEATRERVLRRMKELNYQPSLHAQGLASGRSLMVGFVVPDLVHAFFSEIARTLSATLRDKGYGLLISSSDENPKAERQEIAQMLRRKVDALLIASCQSDPSDFIKCAEDKVPYILVDRKFTQHTAHFVGTNDVLVGEMATAHLVSIGCRRIAHIGGPQVSTSVERLQGYQQTLAHHKIQMPPQYIISRDRVDELGDVTGRLAMEQLLRLKPRPDGVFCYNDPAAIGAMNAVLSMGLRIPQDIAIIGAGNIRYSDSFRVPLSSIDVFSEEVGIQAGRLILSLMSSKRRIAARTIVTTPRLIARESTSPANLPHRKKIRN